jgi:ecdysteroid 25-hydroxylase
MCMGEELAKMFLYLFSANILQRFEIKVGEDPEKLDMNGITGLTLSPPDHKLIFIKRQGN